MLIDSGKRLILTHPHTGRTFFVGDTLNILDCWQATHAYKNALEYGSTYANDGGICWNPGSYRNNEPTALDHLMHHEPVCGMSGGEGDYIGPTVGGGGFPFITPNYAQYSADFGGEINSQHDSFALGIDFRFLSEAEFSTAFLGFNSLGSGIGARAQRLRFVLWEMSTPTVQNPQVVADIFFNYGYYVGIPGATPPFPYMIDLSMPDGAAGEINQYLIVDKIKAALRKSGSSQCRLQCIYELPKSSTGGAWPVNFSSCFAEPIVHPNSGVEYQSWGLLAVTMTHFRSETYTNPTGGAIGPNGRIQTAFPVVPEQVMGQNSGGLLFADLFQMGRAAVGVSWPSVIQGKRSFGGLNRIVLGDTARYQQGTQWAYDDHASQILDIRCQLPSNATRFTLNTLVKYQNTNGGLHTIKFEIERETANNVIGQTLYTASFSTNLAPTWVWVDGALDPLMLPISANVEHIRLKVTVTKSIPRATNWGFPIFAPDIYPPQPCSSIAWDGVGTIYLAFR